MTAALTRTEHRAVSVAGSIVRTFSEEGPGRAWVRRQAARVPGIALETVVVTEARERLYRPRVAPAEDFSIPNIARDDGLAVPSAAQISYRAERQAANRADWFRRALTVAVAVAAVIFGGWLVML